MRKSLLSIVICVSVVILAGVALLYISFYTKSVQPSRDARRTVQSSTFKLLVTPPTSVPHVKPPATPPPHNLK